MRREAIVSVQFDEISKEPVDFHCFFDYIKGYSGSFYYSPESSEVELMSVFYEGSDITVLLPLQLFKSLEREILVLTLDEEC